jgi:DNA-binding NarL/FixJ family response regulator
VTSPSESYVSVARNWATALQTYRHAVDLYRHVLEMRAQRVGGLAPVSGVNIQAAPADSSSESIALLTPREREVAMLISQGLTNQQIAETLIVTRGTVANHVAHILTKLGLANRTQVAAYVVGSPSSAGSAGPPTSSSPARHVTETWLEHPIRKVS